jgi:hypothetical protein
MLNEEFALAQISYGFLASLSRRTGVPSRAAVKLSNATDYAIHSTLSIGMIDVIRPSEMAGRFGRTSWLPHLLAANNARDTKGCGSDGGSD